MTLKYRYKTKPFSHQKKALAKLVKLKGRGGLFMDMGTGKTKVAIDFVGLGFYNWGLTRVVIVCPSTVMGVWQRQLKAHAPYPYYDIPLYGSSVEKAHLIKAVLEPFKTPRVTFLIINYESIWRPIGKTRTRIEDLLVQFKPDLVIYDESHRIKSNSSRQSRSAARMSVHIPQRLLLTGTHITRDPMDSFGQFRAMNVEVFGNNWREFKFKWARWGGFGGFQLIKFLHFDQYVKLVRAHSFRIRKEQCFDLPPKLSVFRPVVLSDSNQRIYKQMAKEQIVQLEGSVATAPIVLTKMLRLQQITSGFIKDENGEIITLGTEKLQACLELWEDLVGDDKKVVIFCRFLHDIEQLSKAFAARKVQFRILSGTVPLQDRDSLVAQWSENPKVKILIAQISTGSEGIDLTAASDAIFYSLTTKASDYWQCKSRLDRYGQTRKVTFHHLVVNRSVDTVILSQLAAKQRMFLAVLHNPKILLTQEMPDPQSLDKVNSDGI